MPDGSNIGVHGARGDLLGTLDGVQIPGGTGNTNRRYVKPSCLRERIFKRTEEARDLLRHHSLTPEQTIDLFTGIGVGVFRYSAALVPWTEKELERLEAV